MNRSQMVVNPLSKGVKYLVIASVGVWLIGQVFIEALAKIPITPFLALRPDRVIFDFHVWQIFTYMFLHSIQITHIFFNMLMLWFFGSELEMRWGTRFFLTYYFVCGIGAGLLYVLCIALFALATGHNLGLRVPVIGASGAVFGLLLAYGMIFGERIIHVFMVFPMKAKHFVILMGAVEFVSMITASQMGDEVAYLAHLGGIVTGFVFLRSWKFWQSYTWNRKVQNKHKGRNLKLVVDNQIDQNKKNSDKDNPRYWN